MSHNSFKYSEDLNNIGKVFKVRSEMCISSWVILYYTVKKVLNSILLKNILQSPSKYEYWLHQWWTLKKKFGQEKFEYNFLMISIEMVKNKTESILDVSIWIPDVFRLEIKCHYSNHLNTRLVRYSNGRKLSSLQMVWYSNGIWIPD